MRLTTQKNQKCFHWKAPWLKENELIVLMDKRGGRLKRGENPQDELVIRPSTCGADETWNIKSASDIVQELRLNNCQKHHLLVNYIQSTEVPRYSGCAAVAWQRLTGEKKRKSVWLRSYVRRRKFQKRSKICMQITPPHPSHHSSWLSSYTPSICGAD